MTDEMKPIPQEWIKNYVDSLMNYAEKIPEGPMRQGVLLRIEHVLDLVKGFRETNP